MFPVRNFLKFIRMSLTVIIKTDKKIWGRRTVASTAVLSRHRFGEFRSDLPSLFNFNLFFMRNSNGQCTTCAKIGEYLPEIKKLHANNRQTLMEWLINSSTSQLIQNFLAEMDAKNRAYYFIIKSGNFDAFADYCKNQD